MFKYAIVGLERIGKTTLVHHICSQLSGAGIEYAMLPEITMLNPALNPPHLNVQLGLLFQQMSNESFITSTAYKDVYITDRTMIDIIPYIAMLNDGIPKYLMELALAWATTFKCIYLIKSVPVDKRSRINKHYVLQDEIDRPIREKYLTTIMARIINTKSADVKIHSLESNYSNFYEISARIFTNIIYDTRESR